MEETNVISKSVKLAVFVLSCVLLLSCSCATSSGSSKLDNNLSIPRASFLKIDVDIVIRSCSEETGACDLDRRDFISGSGFVVDKARHKGTYVMSAGHVCDPSAFANVVALGQPWTLEFSGITKEEKVYKLHVLEVDNEKDLCLLYAPTLERIPIKVATKKLLPGSRIWNVAAPAGVMYRGAPIIIDGIFNGTNLDTGHDMYTMFVAGGSSGSAILNEDGEVVGLVSMMDLRFPFIAISPSHDDLSEFFQRAIVYHENIGAPADKVYKIVLPSLPKLPSLPEIELPELPDLYGMAKEWLADLF
tara:strand:- start:1206 stop:2114 length:909 start_codon:yes stop_codon:yes gene_type:complete